MLFKHLTGGLRFLLFIFIFSFWSTTLQSSPSTFSMEVFISIDADDGKRFPLNGLYTVTFELILDNETIHFSKTFTEFITLGILKITVDEDDQLDIAPFKANNQSIHARIHISGKSLPSDSTVNTSPSSFSNRVETFDFQLFNVTHVKKSAASDATKTFDTPKNKSLFKLDPNHFTASIGTTNAISRVHVDGTIRATSFKGDGSKLLNLNLIRWVRVNNPERIYYDQGYVGIGLQTPTENLHVSGNLSVSPDDDRPQKMAGDGDDPLFTIRDTLMADFRGEAPLISSLNASHFSTGSLNSPHLIEKYPMITGVGALTSATWNSTTQILDAHVANDLTIEGHSVFRNGSLSGKLTMGEHLNIDANTHPFIMHSKDWHMDSNGRISQLETHGMRLSTDTLHYDDTVTIQTTNGDFFKLNAEGKFSFGHVPSTAKFNPTQGIRIGSTTTTSPAPGTIKLDTYFMGYSLTNTGSYGWNRLDESGTFTGYSLFPEHRFSDPKIQILPLERGAFIGVHESRPQDHLVASGNIVFEGHSSSPPPSDITNEQAFLWIASKGALRIGSSNAIDLSDSMFFYDNVGLYSVAMGQDSLASGEGAINISFSNEVNSTSNASGDYSVMLGSTKGNLSHPNSIAFSSSQLQFNTGENSSNILFSSAIESSSTPPFSGSHNIVFNGKNPTTEFNHTIMGGQTLHTAYGNDSFIWGSTRSFPLTFSRESHQVDKSFVISPFLNVGINSEIAAQSNAALTIGGDVQAPMFYGSGDQLSGDIKTVYLTVDIDGTIEDVYPTHTKTPHAIYVSNERHIMPNDTISASTINDKSIEGADIKTSHLGSHKFSNGSISGDRLQHGALTSDHFQSNSLDQRLFSNIGGKNFEDHSITDEKLAKPSIYTKHFVNEAVTKNHINADMVNSPINNIALHAITPADIYVEQLTSSPIDYFDNGAATGFNITHNALSTTLAQNGSIESSYFVYQTTDTPPEPSPQIQEQHLNSQSVRSIHIDDDQIISRHFSNGSIQTEDLTHNAIETYPTVALEENDPKIIANARTLVDGPIFIGRHFADRALTTPKIFDDCSDCASPTENFQLQTHQIANQVIRYDDDDGDGVDGDELAEKSVFLDHITPNAIVGRHIQTDAITTAKFHNRTIISSNIAENAVTSNHILDGTLAISTLELLGDFSLKSFYGKHLVSKEILRTHIQSEAIVSRHVSDDSITSNHIIDYNRVTDSGGLSEDDFQPGAFTASKIQNATVTSDNIGEYVILDAHLATFNLLADQFQDHSVTWNNFIPPPEGQFPTDRFADNSLAFFIEGGIGQKFENDITIHGENLATKSVSYDKIAFNNSADGFPQAKLMTPLSVNNGGTGVSSFTRDEIVFVDTHPTHSKFAQTAIFNYKRNPNGILTIGEPSVPVFSQGLITTGNILITNGALILASYQDNELFTFVKYNSDDQAIQLTHREPLDATTHNMMVKTNILYSKEAIRIGESNQANMIDLASGFSFGATYRGETPPLNGMIIEGTLQIGGEDPLSALDDSSTLDGYVLKVDAGTIQSTSSNIGIRLTGTNPADPDDPPDSSTPILTEGRSIQAKGSIGIDISVTDASQAVPIRVTMNADSTSDERSVGINSIIVDDSVRTTASAVQVIMPNVSSTTIQKNVMGHINREGDPFYAGIYGEIDEESDEATNYAGYFEEAPVLSTYLTDKPTHQAANLHMTLFKPEQTIAIQPQTNIILSIDWTQGNVAMVDVDNNNRTITFQHPPQQSAKLLIHVTHSGSGRLSFMTPGLETIKWHKDYPPELTAIDGSVDIVMFMYDHDTKTYHGSAAYDFKTLD